MNVQVSAAVKPWIDPPVGVGRVPLELTSALAGREMMNLSRAVPGDAKAAAERVMVCAVDTIVDAGMGATEVPTSAVSVPPTQAPATDV